MNKERYFRALRKRVYALGESGAITASDASVILTCREKRYGRLTRGLTVERLPSSNRHEGKVTR